MATPSSKPTPHAGQPTGGRRALVLWPGDHGHAVLRQVDQEIVGMIAMPLALAERNHGLLAAAHERGIGVMYDGEAWRNQLKTDHRLRGPAFDGLGYHYKAGVLRPEDGLLPDAWTEAYAEAYLEPQRGAAAFTTPGHYSPNPVGTARQNDLALAAACAEHFSAAELGEPALSDPQQVRPSLYATIVVQPRFLDAGSIDELIEAYAGLDVHGYVIWAVNFGFSRRQYERVRALALGLEARTGRPCVVGGLGHGFQAALANGIAAACHGPGRSALHWPPPEPPDEDEGFDVCVYHGAILGAVAIGRLYDAARRRLFIANPCPCGHHDPSTPPEGRAEKSGHNGYWLMIEARAACANPVQQASGRLAARLPEAARRRTSLNLGVLRTGWQAVRPPDEQRGRVTGAD